MAWSWANKARATFRDVEFYVDTTERSGGRRVATHEFPGSEKAPFQEDLGALGKVFPVDGFVLGDNYLDARDALADALDLPGPGELVHPSYGTRAVVVTGYRINETRSDGGIAKFSIEFAETSEQVFPTSTGVAASALSSSVTALNTSAQTQFLDTFQSIPTFQLSSVQAIQIVSSAVAALGDAQSLAAQDLANLHKETDDLSQSAHSLTADPTALVTAQVHLFQTLATGLLNKSSGLNPVSALLSLFDLDLGPRPPDTTVNRRTEQANFDAYKAVVQRSVIAQASTATLAVQFASYDSAVATRTQITDCLDAHLEEMTDDTFPALTALRAALVRAIPGESSDLPRIEHFTSVATVPSLVLAQRLYGNLDREQDLIDRNHVRNPMFVTGGTRLEVLTDE